MLSLLQQRRVPHVAANAFDPVQILFVFDLPHRKMHTFNPRSFQRISSDIIINEI